MARKIWQIWTGTGSDPATRYLGASKISGGWPYEAAIHLKDNFATFGGSGLIVHLPWGCEDTAAMEFDGYLSTNTCLTRLKNTSEFVESFTMLAQIQWSQGNSGFQFAFYFGSPENSATLTALWAANDLIAWRKRIMDSLGPIPELQRNLLRLNIWAPPIMICVDSADSRAEGSQSHAACVFLRDQGYDVMIEATPYVANPWTNSVGTPMSPQIPFYSMHTDTAWDLADPLLLGLGSILVRPALLVTINAGNGTPADYIAQCVSRLADFDIIVQNNFYYTGTATAGSIYAAAGSP